MSQMLLSIYAAMDWLKIDNKLEAVKCDALIMHDVCFRLVPISVGIDTKPIF